MSERQLSERIDQLEKAHARAIAERDWMVDVLIDHWHEMPASIAHDGLPSWLEFTQEQYARWAQDPMDFPPVPDRQHGQDDRP